MSGMVLTRIPIGGPLPGVANHVVETVAVWWKGTDRGGPLEAIEREILDWEFALPVVGEHFSFRRELVAPGEVLSYEAAARGEFPFGFGRNCLAGPLGVGLDILPGDVEDGI